jgi:hypothetical protein
MRDRGAPVTVSQPALAAGRRLIRRLLARHDHPDAAATPTAQALALKMCTSQLGEHERARELVEGALARFRRVLGEDHPDTLTSADNLAEDLRQLGDAQRVHRATA